MKSKKLFAIPFAVLALGLASCNATGKGSLVEDNKEAAKAFLEGLNSTVQDLDNLGGTIKLSDVNFEANISRGGVEPIQSGTIVPAKILEFHKLNVKNSKATLDFKATNLAHDNKSAKYKEHEDQVFDNYINANLKDVNLDVSITDQLFDVTTGIQDKSASASFFIENHDLDEESDYYDQQGFSHVFVDLTKTRDLTQNIFDTLKVTADKYAEIAKNLYIEGAEEQLEQFEIAKGLADRYTEIIANFYRSFYSNADRVWTKLPNLTGGPATYLDNIALKINNLRQEFDHITLNNFVNKYKDFSKLCDGRLECYKSGTNYTYTLDLNGKLIIDLIKALRQGGQVVDNGNSYSDMPNIEGNLIINLTTNKDTEFSHLDLEFKDFVYDGPIRKRNVNVKVSNLNAKVSLDVDYNSFSASNVEDEIMKLKENYNWRYFNSRSDLANEESIAVAE